MTKIAEMIVFVYTMSLRAHVDASIDLPAYVTERMLAHALKTLFGPEYQYRHHISGQRTHQPRTIDFGYANRQRIIHSCNRTVQNEKDQHNRGYTTVRSKVLARKNNVGPQPLEKVSYSASYRRGISKAAHDANAMTVQR